MYFIQISFFFRIFFLFLQYTKGCNIMKAIILNSGVGSRLKEYTANNPKSMVQITNNDTIFSKAMKLLRKYDIDVFPSRLSRKPRNILWKTFRI